MFDMDVSKKIHFVLTDNCNSHLYRNFCDLQADELPPEQLAGMYSNLKQFINFQ